HVANGRPPRPHAGTGHRPPLRVLRRGAAAVGPWSGAGLARPPRRRGRRDRAVTTRAVTYEAWGAFLMTAKASPWGPVNVAMRPTSGMSNASASTPAPSFLAWATVASVSAT